MVSLKLLTKTCPKSAKECTDVMREKSDLENREQKTYKRNSYLSGFILARESAVMISDWQ